MGARTMSELESARRELLQGAPTGKILGAMALLEVKGWAPLARDERRAWGWMVSELDRRGEAMHGFDAYWAMDPKEGEGSVAFYSRVLGEVPA